MDLDRYWVDVGRAGLMTLSLTGIALVLGATSGLPLALLMMSRHRAIRLPTTVYVDFWRTTPPLVQLIWCYYVLPALTGIDLPAFWWVAIGLGLNVGAFMSEIYKAGIRAVGRGQSDAASVLGLRKFDAFRLVVFPQALRVILPSMAALTMLTLKNTSLAAELAVLELTYVTTLISQQTYQFFEAFTMLAIIYLVLVLPLSIGAGQIEKRFRYSQRFAA